MNKKKINPLASFGRTILSLFIPNRKAVNILEEEAVVTPGKTILKNFLGNRLGLLGVTIFVLVLLFSFVGSLIVPFNPSYTELTMSNAKPGMSYLKAPKEVSENTDKLVKISSGTTFSAALMEDGNIHLWGVERAISQKGISDPIFQIPESVTNAHIVDIQAGGAHIIALDSEGKLHGWGHYGNGQVLPDTSLASWGKSLEEGTLDIKMMMAQQQWSGILTESGHFYLWGSTSATEKIYTSKETRGRIVDAAYGDNNVVVLLDDGTLRILGEVGTEYNVSFPPALADGSVKVVDVVSTNRNVLALDDTGKLWLWGSSQDSLTQIPEYEGTIKSIGASYKNFWIILEDGTVVIWGANDLGQLKLPKNLPPIEKIYGEYSKFFAIDTEGKLHAWGNKGYLFGSDQYGRDLLTRIIHGGRISLTVGAIAVLISTVIALIVGMTAGFYGGWVDMILMRVTDIVISIPFMPIAITLSAVIGHNMSSMNKLYMIMVIMGVLGWTGLARLIRASILLEREKDFVLAARSLGIKQNKIIIRHILPNVFNMVIVSVTLSYASSLLSEAGLSFLGYGVAEPTPSWGNMLQSAQTTTVIEQYWWRWFIPALFVIFAALSVNLIGDALREAMDPKSNDR